MRHRRLSVAHATGCATDFCGACYRVRHRFLWRILCPCATEYAFSVHMHRFAPQKSCGPHHQLQGHRNHMSPTPNDWVLALSVAHGCWCATRMKHYVARPERDAPQKVDTDGFLPLPFSFPTLSRFHSLLHDVTNPPPLLRIHRHRRPCCRPALFLLN